MTNSLLFHRMNFPDELSKLGCMHGCGPCDNAKSQIKTVPKVAFMNVVLSPGSFITYGMCAQIFKTNCLFFSNHWLRDGCEEMVVTCDAM